MTLEQAYPLEWPEGWPRTPERQRKDRSQFNTTFDKARVDLFAELRRLGAANVVVSSWLPIRRDGNPYSSAARRRIEDPGVAVYFTLNGRRMAMARDAYWNIHDNMRSIGLAIEHLRGLERHGGGHMMERAFDGFTALPPPSSSKGHWSNILGVPADAHEDVIRHAYKQAAKRTHPDMGGDATQFAAVQRAYEESQAERIRER